MCDIRPFRTNYQYLIIGNSMTIFIFYFSIFRLWCKAILWKCSLFNIRPRLNFLYSCCFHENLLSVQAFSYLYCFWKLTLPITRNNWKKSAFFIVYFFHMLLKTGNEPHFWQMREGLRTRKIFSSGLRQLAGYISIEKFVLLRL